ncbi:hypothetical protein HY357_02005 [Candidatus Roizmanbacteria bacterium]|nr:hypothetical protein [Candidatus Roizmanbacteria bacterium]
MMLKTLVKKIPIPIKDLVKSVFYSLKGFWNREFIGYLIAKRPYLHVGCGFEKLPHCINVDIKPTKATDIVEDCNNLEVFPNNSFFVIYGNAFFEHLFYKQRPIHLANLYRILKNRGAVVYIGIPDFESLAKAYLEKKNGIINKHFDLEEVYRYTHGDPEQVASKYWLYQLHKTLFDQKEVEKLLLKAGFRSFCIFRYSFRQEKLAISLGFIAFKGRPSIRFNVKEIYDFIKQYTKDVSDKNLSLLKTLE